MAVTVIYNLNIFGNGGTNIIATCNLCMNKQSLVTHQQQLDMYLDVTLSQNSRLHKLFMAPYTSHALKSGIICGILMHNLMCGFVVQPPTLT